MMIKEFAEKYGVSRRDIDYWTNCGLLHPRVMSNGYRDYGQRAEDEMQNILVAMMIDEPGSIESTCEKLNCYGSEEWGVLAEKLNETKKRIVRKYNSAYETASKRSQGG